jgi:hypothetical protein
VSLWPIKLTEFLDTPGLRSHGDRMTEKEIDREVKRRLAIFEHADEVT